MPWPALSFPWVLQDNFAIQVCLDCETRRPGPPPQIGLWPPPAPLRAGN